MDRAALPAFLAAYIDDPAAAAANLARMQAFLADVPGAELAATRDRLAKLGDELRLYPADPLGRRLSRVWCEDVLISADVDGLEHVDAVQASAGPIVVVCNHRSYFDTTATDAALAWAGRAAFADRLAAVAGPKVYADLFRRFAAACLNTLPAPQSTSLEGTERLSPRELARRALEAIRHAHEAMSAGYVVLLYPEGSRTRTGRLRPFLKGVHRYLDGPGTRVLPAAVLGTDEVMPVSGDRLHPSRVRLRFGPPIDVAAAGGPVAALEAAHRAVADLLPPDQRPADDEPAVA